jgi:glucose-6-phosphate 1-dehydrogenase
MISMLGDDAKSSERRCSDPCVLVIFGASGDLAKRLLIPALYHLAASGLLPDAFAVLGIARSNLAREEFQRRCSEALDAFAGVAPDRAVRAWLVQRLYYVSGDFAEPATHRRLAEALTAIDAEHHTRGNCLFYLATPPAAFVPIIRQLGKSGLPREQGNWRRIIIEKPFGVDLASAQTLNRDVLAVFDELQIYRIDHYLGKETVQNIMALRFANGLFESLWNRDRIDHVQITVAETLTVEGRSKFYDATGALRDMVPNHLFQLLSLVAMEPPARFDADSVRAEKLKLLSAVQPYSSEVAMRDAVRGQYGTGIVAGQDIVAYRQVPGVASYSATETYVALRLMIDNWRWAGVPFYLRTGKALAARRTEIAIKFREAPFTLFRETPIERLAQNFIVIRIQPDEGIALQFNAKVPGPRLLLDGVRMDFKYKDYFDAAPTTGYETLIYDCMIGDRTLFQQAQEVEIAWRIVQPFLDDWREAPVRDLAIYPAGSEGPPEADDLLARDGRQWRPIALRGAAS